MKYFIEDNLNAYGMFSKPSQVLKHAFCTLGNGIHLNLQGYLEGNYRSEECYEFGEPEPINHIYRWSTDEEFQPFRELAGCRDVGFKESFAYFIECLKITPDTVDYIKEWKENIPLMEDVIYNTPTITDEYTSINDIDGFLTKLKASVTTTDDHGGSTTNPTNSVDKRWFFDVQWSDCPDFVEKEVRQSWDDYELGNDKYIWKAKVDKELYEAYPNIYFWLKHKGVPDGEKVYVHWWW